MKNCRQNCIYNKINVTAKFHLIYNLSLIQLLRTGTKQINCINEGVPDIELSTGSSSTGVIQSDAHQDGLSK